MKSEYRLLLLSVLKERTPAEDEELIQLLSNNLDWELVGGQLLNHRLGGYFLSGLSRNGLLKKAPRELIKALELLVLAQRQQTLQIIKITTPVFEEFDNHDIRYAALKGAVFNAGLYSPGDRRSNDTDLLIFEADLDKAGEILRSHGYIQTFMTNGEYKEASRKEKLIQRLNYHDLVPYVKLLDNDYLPSHEFDINFHFDSKENDITQPILDFGTIYYENEYCKVKGLPWETNLAHLAVHFYREATNSLWTAGKRDVVLYKLVDVMNVLRSCTDESKICNWPQLMKHFHLEKAAFYTLHTLLQFYEDSILKQLMDGFEFEDQSFLYEIKVEGENRIDQRTESFSESAFNLSR